MAYTTEGITHVRMRPLALDVVPGGVAILPGAVEVTWDSTQNLRWHQVYVNGRLAGVTAALDDRRLIVSGPVGRDGPGGVLLAEVLAVDVADRWKDFSSELDGFGEGGGTEVLLTWQAGQYLDPNLESFDIFSDDRTGTVNYTAPINELPIPAKPGGQLLWGYGCGGYGVGGYGQAAAQYEWTTDVLEPGMWRFAVVAVDAAGNCLATAAEVAVNVTPVARPPSNFRMTAYDAQTRTATLAWELSPDL